MLVRLRSSWLAAGGAALVFVLALSGAVAAAGLVSTITPQESETTEPDPASDTVLTFEDVDGNNVDDDCQTGVVANEDAAAAAETAADLDGDGVISTSEAAQSERTGGVNCNHGGYVSTVARGLDAAPADDSGDTAPTECETGSGTPATTDETIVSAEANAHGKAVADVARSDAVGGKNCNHGGAVSEKAKDNHGHGQSAAASAASHGGHGRGGRH